MLPTKPTRIDNPRKLRDSGHLLLAILLMMALMVIAAGYLAPSMVQQMKRDREAEMIHRGTEYARAIKKYYKKFGRYPTSIEQLESTNNIRFLRKRYKDPLTKDGKWTLLHYQDVAAVLTTAGGGPGIPAAALGAQGQQGLGVPAGQAGSTFGRSPFTQSGPNSSGGFGTSNFGGSPQPQSGTNTQGGIFSQSQGSSDQTQGGSSTFGGAGQSSTGGLGSTSGTGFGANNPSSGSSSGANPATPSTTLGPQNSLTGQTFGAGAILGVGSKSKDPTIRVYNKKKTYDEWQFIYNPLMDQANVLLKGPYSPNAFVGGSNIGTPAGQMNQPGQQSPFGQQNSPLGQQGGFGNQQPGGTNQQPITPGPQYPSNPSH